MVFPQPLSALCLPKDLRGRMGIRNSKFVQTAFRAAVDSSWKGFLIIPTKAIGLCAYVYYEDCKHMFSIRISKL